MVKTDRKVRAAQVRDTGGPLIVTVSAAQRRARSIAELASRASRSRPEIEEALRHAAESLERTAVARGLIELLGAAQVPAEVREHGAALEDATRGAAIRWCNGWRC